jgi:tetratricopeptide (TPR) repeat protein
MIGYPYGDSVSRIYEGEVLRKLGMDILIEQFTGYPQGGTSGSPVIDANGFLVGIHSSNSSDGASGKNVTVAVGAEYLKGVLMQKPDLNTPKKDYGKLILDTVLKKGTQKAIRQYNALTRNPENYYIYNLRSAHRNGLRETGEKLMEMNHFRDAVYILEYNVKMNPFFYRDYNILAKAWLLMGNKEEAIKNYTLSTTRYDDRENNEAFKELARLGVSR